MTYDFIEFNINGKNKIVTTNTANNLGTYVKVCSEIEVAA
jgi:hypothetical protein